MIYESMIFFWGMDLRVHFEMFEVYQSFLVSELGDVFD